jgi:CubicO group peptidase (beta-lactamase class C family)
MQTNAEQVLVRSQPEHEGIASQAILQWVEALETQIHEIHSFMLLRHGHVVAEGWWAPYQPDYLHLLFSVSKSFTSTAVGLAVADGHLSIDDPVLSFFPDEKPAEVSDFLAAMTVRHLLTMTTGHADDTWPIQVARADGDWIRAFLNAPVTHPPGTHFFYNTGASYILAAIVEKTTGIKLIDYLRPRFFEPLGIQTASWQESPQGIAVGGYGLSLTTEALARFGQLYLQKGKWGDRQILPEAWVEAATSTQFVGSNRYGPSDWSQGYGYQFWRCRHDAYQASGVFGQCCIVMPQQDAVLAITSGIDVFEVQQLLDLVWKFLLPAFESEQGVENTTEQEKLAKKLSNLTLTPEHSTSPSPQPFQATGRSYALDANPLNIEALTLDFTQIDSLVTFKTPGHEDTLCCGDGEWRRSQTNLFNLYNGPWLSDSPTPVMSSGGWVSNDCFSMIVRLVETPFFYRLTYHFVGDELLLEMQVNVTMEIQKNLLLTARLAVGVM